MQFDHCWQNIKLLVTAKFCLLIAFTLVKRFGIAMFLFLLFLLSSCFNFRDNYRKIDSYVNTVTVIFSSDFNLVPRIIFSGGHKLEKADRVFFVGAKSPLETRLIWFCLRIEYVDLQFRTLSLSKGSQTFQRKAHVRLEAFCHF